ncbi:aspartyl/glutamyl-tRNA amidotransferase subunit C, partial [Kibdelosporangium lantanae]
MPTISRAEVEHLAKLARLAVTDQELDVFAGQFNRWFDHNGDIWMSKSGAPAGYMFAGSYGLPAP